MQQPQSTPSNWNIPNPPSGTWYRDGNHAVREYPAQQNNEMVNYKDNFRSILNDNDKATVANTDMSPDNMSVVDANLIDLHPDFSDIDVNFFNNSFSRLLVNGNNESPPTR